MAKLLYKQGTFRVVSNDLNKITDTEALYAHLKEVACTCYQSREWTTTTPEKMVQALIKRRHGAMTEHTMFTYLIKGILTQIPVNAIAIFRDTLRTLDQHFIISQRNDTDVIISFNARVLINAFDTLANGNGRMQYDELTTVNDIVSRNPEFAEWCKLNDAPINLDSAVSDYEIGSLNMTTLDTLAFIANTLRQIYPALFSDLALVEGVYLKNQDIEIERNPVLISPLEKLIHTAITIEWNNSSIGQSREWNRHRCGNNEMICLAEESTRYCDYSKDKDSNDNEIQFVLPYMERIRKIGKYNYAIPKYDGKDSAGKDLYDANNELRLKRVVEAVEDIYKLLRRDYNLKPEEARQWLPLGLKSQEVCTVNLLKLRRIFKLRCAPAAHPEIRHNTQLLLAWCIKEFPGLFDDLGRKFL